MITINSTTFLLFQFLKGKNKKKIKNFFCATVNILNSLVEIYKVLKYNKIYFSYGFFQKLKNTYFYIFSCIRQNDEYNKNYESRKYHVGTFGNAIFCMDST